MKNDIIAIFAILFGIIIIAFPIFGVVGASAILGLSVLLLAVYSLIVGMAIIDYNKTGAILDLIIGILLLFLSIALIFNPSILGILTQLTFYIGGILLIIGGLVSLLNNRTSRFGFYGGISGIILGVLYIIVGTYISNPIVLGTFIGIWLIISGILKFMDR